jgi:phage terminase Nu1 subunit (DNA packaging protein)
MSAGSPGKLGVSQFAKLVGVTPAAVSRAIATGRMKNSLTQLPNGKWEIDAAIGRVEFEDGKLRGARNYSKVMATVQAQKDADLDEGSLAKYERQSAKYTAEMKRLKYEEAARILVPMAEVEKQWNHNAGVARAKVLAIPSRIRQRMPELTVDQYFLIEEIVRTSLEELVSENVEEIEDDATEDFEEAINEPTDSPLE